METGGLLVMHIKMVVEKYFVTTAVTGKKKAFKYIYL